MSPSSPPSGYSDEFESIDEEIGAADVSGISEQLVGSDLQSSASSSSTSSSTRSSTSLSSSQSSAPMFKLNDAVAPLNLAPATDDAVVVADKTPATSPQVIVMVCVRACVRACVVVVLHGISVGVLARSSHSWFFKI